jgi:hypothetical protein
MKTSDKVRILSQLTTRDHAGVHFASKFAYSELAALEADGLIAINRPVHPTGIPYSGERWSVEVTPEGVELVEANPEDCDAAK